MHAIGSFTKALQNSAPLACAALLFAAPGCNSLSTQRAYAAVGPSWTQFRLNGRNDATLAGKLRVAWRLETRGGFSSSPAIFNSTVYIGNNDGMLYALDLRTGHVRWNYRVAAPLMSNPLVYDNLVIVGEGDRVWYSGDGDHPDMMGATENALIALDSRTGAPRWRLRLLGTGMPTPAIIDGTLVHHDGSGEILFVDPEDGTVIARRNAHSVAAMSAIVPTGNGRFITNGVRQPTMQEWDVHDASQRWLTELNPSGKGAGDCPAASDGRFVFCDYAGPPDATATLERGAPAAERVYAVDESSGELVWEVPLEVGIMPRYNLSAIPMVAGDTLYVGSAVAPYVHALGTEDGKLRWSTRVHAPVKGSVAFARGVVYFGDLAGYLWALDARTGRIVGCKNMHTAFNVGSPVIAGETLVIGTKTGAVIAEPLDDIRASHDS